VAAAFLAKNGDGPVDWRSGVFGFPHPPRPSPLPVGPRGFSLAVRSRFPKKPRASLALTLLSGGVPNALAFPGLLSGFVHTVSHACATVCPLPLHRHAQEASTPGMTACHPFGSEGSTLEVLFHPRGFAPPRWFPPLLELRACCIPLPILGFIRVSVPSDR